MIKYTDLPEFAAKYFQASRIAAVEALIRNGPNVKYVPNNTHADAKLIVVWWTAALARRLPSGMARYAVSPGGATATKVVRSPSPILTCTARSRLDQFVTTGVTDQAMLKSVFGSIFAQYVAVARVEPRLHVFGHVHAA